VRGLARQGLDLVATMREIATITSTIFLLLFSGISPHGRLPNDHL